MHVDAPTATTLAVAFKALGDPVRLQLMSMIASAPGGEICVCDLTPATLLTPDA
jgi:ArsR family transcriptional regulator, arsenate/arsenite/antimonite-responsive transcriptional repressor